MVEEYRFLTFVVQCCHCWRDGGLLNENVLQKGCGERISRGVMGVSVQHDRQRTATVKLGLLDCKSGSFY